MNSFTLSTAGTTDQTRFDPFVQINHAVTNLRMGKSDVRRPNTLAAPLTQRPRRDPENLSYCSSVKKIFWNGRRCRCTNFRHERKTSQLEYFPERGTFPAVSGRPEVPCTTRWPRPMSRLLLYKSANSLPNLYINISLRRRFTSFTCSVCYTVATATLSGLSRSIY